MMERPSRTRTATLALCAVLLALLVAAPPALAATSAELSDDGQDYGWLYRRGNKLYALSESDPPRYEYVPKDDCWRKYADKPFYSDMCWSSLYADGLLHLHKNLVVDLDAVIASGEELRVEYTGSPCCPQVAVVSGGVELVEGEDYVVSYRDNVEVGTAAVLLQGKGDYYGHVAVPFVIQDTGAYALLY